MGVMFKGRDESKHLLTEGKIWGWGGGKQKTVKKEQRENKYGT